MANFSYNRILNSHKTIKGGSLKSYKFEMRPIESVVQVGQKKSNTPVTGYMTELPDLNMKAEWGVPSDGLVSIINNSAIAEAARDLGRLDYAGVRIGESGLATRKTFSGSVDFEFSVNFKVYDEDPDSDEGQGNVVRQFLRIAAYMLPRSLIDITVEDAVKRLNDIQAAEDLKAKSDKEDAAKTSSESTTTTTATKSTFDQVAENIVYNELLDLGVSVTASPIPVVLTIGDFMVFKDMVVTHFTPKFSFERTEYGPLYGDFTLSFSTRESVYLKKDTNGNTGFNNISFIQQTVKK